MNNKNYRFLINFISVVSWLVSLALTCYLCLRVFGTGTWFWVVVGIGVGLVINTIEILALYKWLRSDGVFALVMVACFGLASLAGSVGGLQMSFDKGQMVRVILESLAGHYKSVIEVLERIGGREIEVIHIVGGGCQNEFLCQLTADATGKEVAAGPAEATAMGNIMIQALAEGQIRTLSEGRDMIRRSACLKRYYPKDSDTTKT